MLRARFEYVVAAVAMATVATMVTWWAVLARRLVSDNVRLQEQLLTLQTGAPVDLSAETSRLHGMVTSEFVAIAVAIVSALAALLYVSRQRTLGQIRMERLLQFTSHELKTPIAGVRALLQSLQMGAVPEERRFEFMARGLQEVDRLEHLAETILTWQRSVAANDTLTPQRLEAKELVHQVLDHRLKTGVQERIEVNGLDDTAVLADADAFRVIFENLLDNARKYGGGATTVSAQRLGAVWTLTVKDAGAGFPAGDVQLIFDPFRRTKHEGMTHGTGLGLFISRQLAVRMKGDLTAQSDGPGRGAAFTISLPVSEGHRG